MSQAEVVVEAPAVFDLAYNHGAFVNGITYGGFLFSMYFLILKASHIYIVIILGFVVMMQTFKFAGAKWHAMNVQNVEERKQINSEEKFKKAGRKIVALGVFIAFSIAVILLMS